MNEEEKKNETLYTLYCPSCGIAFGIPKEIEPIWRITHKQFQCPNGHPCVWEDETTEQKEHKERIKKVEALEEKLNSALKELEKQKKRADDLEAELEIWQPSSDAIENKKTELNT